tara:strand:+ start:21 stop:677 length:657 start_codon:yes stop_codon:yes gene_type:complete
MSDDPGRRLYNPPAFREDDPETLYRLIEAMPLATLITASEEGPLASHLPLLAARGADGRATLRGHLAAANPQVETLDGQPALAVFHGPAYYVTPAWYASKREHGRVVPTWNYVVVHVRGRVSVYRDAARLRALVDDLTAQMERHRDQPWAVTDAPASFVDRMVGQIVGVDLEVTSIEGKLKLGQNRPAADRASLAAGLAAELPDVAGRLAGLPGMPAD